MPKKKPKKRKPAPSEEPAVAVELVEPTTYNPGTKADPVLAPADRDLAIAVAGFLLDPHASDARAAEAFGVNERTVRRWKSCTWWRAIQEEAVGRYKLDVLDQAALVGLEWGLRVDGKLAFAYAQRRWPGHLPMPAGGNGGGPGGPAGGAGATALVQVFVAGAPALALEEPAIEEVEAEVEVVAETPGTAGGRTRAPRARARTARRGGAAARRRRRDPDT